MTGGKKSYIHLRYFFAISLMFLSASTPLSVFAINNLDDIQIDLNSCTSTLEATSGDNGEEQTWNYFIATGIKGFSGNAAAISGIMSNIKQASNFDPYLQNDNYYGLLQWNKTTNPKLFNQIDALGQYWHTKDSASTVPDDARNEALKLQLDYLIQQDQFKKFFSNLGQTDHTSGEAGAQSYAELFLIYDTEATNGTDILTDSYVRSQAKYSRYSNVITLRTDAKKFYQKFVKPKSRSSSASSLLDLSNKTNPFTPNTLAKSKPTPQSNPFTLAAKTPPDLETAVMKAKNAEKDYTEFEPAGAAWNDLDDSSIIRMLENYGDLAYQLGRSIGAPWIAILVQMRYEDPHSICGRNNFWGNGCPAGTGAGGASIQGANLGEGFIQYGKTLTNGYHDQAIGELNPKTYLSKIGPTWVQGDPNGPGYGAIDGMHNSVDAMLRVINTPEGQAILETFTDYEGDYSGYNYSYGSGSSIRYDSGCDSTGTPTPISADGSSTNATKPGEIPSGTREQREAWLFPNGIPQTAEAMEPYLTTIQVPILNADGKHANYTLRVNKKLISGYTSAFQDITDAGFRTTNDTESYRWEPHIPGTVSGAMSVHSYGAAVDLNPTANPATETDTSWYKAVNMDPTHIDDEIVTLWLNNKFWWGGCFTNTVDIHHFTYIELGADKTRYPICAKQQ